MEIEVSKNLEKLAKAFCDKKHNLYVVGGFVRNSLMGIGNTDVDIAGAMSVNAVMDLCQILGFRAQVINKNLGTVLITADNEQFEYTTFRAESYSEGGGHIPKQVEFVEDIKLDALRRDFTINALYYDITNKKIIDFFNGVSDLEKKVLKTCKAPAETFADDGDRILRLVRFVCELGFVPDKQTLKEAIRVCSNVGGISKERILKEIKETICGPLKYNSKSTNHKLMVKYYNKLRVWQYIFNSSFANFKIVPYNKMFNVFVKSSGENRYIAFACMVLNAYLKTKTTFSNLFAVVNTLFGGVGLKESNKNLKEILDVYLFVQMLLYDKPKTYLNNRTCLQFEGFSAEAKALLLLVNENIINDIKLNIFEMKKQQVPFSINELKILSDDLILKLKIKNENISIIKQKLFDMCVNGKIINDRIILIEHAKQLNKMLENGPVLKRNAK